jgi:hypothetical protein
MSSRSLMNGVLVALLVLHGVIGGGVTTAKAQPQRIIEHNTDRPGSGLRDFDLPDAYPELCLAECASDNRCRAWTYVKPGIQGRKARCWLKHSVPRATESPNCVSGVKSGSFIVEHNTDRPGSDIRDFDLPEAYPELCLAECASDNRCRAWTYVKPGIQGRKARCWLKHSVPNEVQGSCCVSGIKR